MNNILQKLWQLIKKQSVIWISTTIIAILTAFSGIIVDNIKTGLLTASKRSEVFNDLAPKISLYIFASNSLLDCFKEGLNFKKISKSFLKYNADDYNNQLQNLIKDEYTFKAKIKKYFNRKILVFKTDNVQDYDSLILKIKVFDKSIHQLNSISLEIENRKDTIYFISKNDSIFLAKQIPLIEGHINDVRKKTESLLNNL